MKRYSFTIQGKAYDVTVQGVQDLEAEVVVNGTPYRVDLAPAPEASQPEGQEPAEGTEKTDQKEAAPAPAPKRARPEGRHRPLPLHPGTAVTSPMPGIILEVSVREGQSVRRGDKVAILEAMKMENEIQASCDGTVTGIYVNPGDSVADDVTILTIG